MPESMKQKRERENRSYVEDVDKLSEEKRLPPANIIICGIAGVGKSTLLNAVFGNNVAATGIGKPQTKVSQDYHNEDVPIRFWDTAGFEISQDGKRTAETLNAIRKLIDEKSDSLDNFDRIHAIWYCIGAPSKRFQEMEANFVANLKRLGVPFIIVMTQCYDEDEDNEFEQRIKEAISETGIPDIPIIQIVAQSKKWKNPVTKEYFEIPSKGLEELVDFTIDNIPEYLKTSFIAAQRVSKEEKHKRAVKEIIGKVKYAENDFWAKIPIARIITSNKHVTNLFLTITDIYNMPIFRKHSGSIEDICHDTTNDIINGSLMDFWSFKDDLSKELRRIMRNIQIGDEFTDIKIEDLSGGLKIKIVIAISAFRFMNVLEEVWDECTEQELNNINILLNKIKRKMTEHKLRLPNSK